jgi:hypothetical protein
LPKCNTTLVHENERRPSTSYYNNISLLGTFDLHLHQQDLVHSSSQMWNQLLFHAVSMTIIN